MRRKLSSLEALNLLIIFATSTNAFFFISFRIRFFSFAFEWKKFLAGVERGGGKLLDEGKVAISSFALLTTCQSPRLTLNLLNEASNEVNRKLTVLYLLIMAVCCISLKNLTQIFEAEAFIDFSTRFCAQFHNFPPCARSHVGWWSITKAEEISN